MLYVLYGVSTEQRYNLHMSTLLICYQLNRNEMRQNIFSHETHSLTRTNNSRMLFSSYLVQRSRSAELNVRIETAVITYLDQRGKKFGFSYSRLSIMRMRFVVKHLLRGDRAACSSSSFTYQPPFSFLPRPPPLRYRRSRFYFRPN